MSLPISIGIPDEVKGSLGFNLPPDAKSIQAKILPNNVSSISSGTLTIPTTQATGNVELTFPSQEIRFSIPCMQSPSMYLDTRMTSLTYRMTVTCTNASAPAAGAMSAYLRSSANAFFDRAYVLGPNNNTLEDILEYGVVCDTLQMLQLSNSDRDGLANMFGFTNDGTGGGSLSVQGTKVDILNAGYASLVTPNLSTHSFTVPVVSSVIGVTNDSFVNNGRLNSLTYVLQTASVLPFNINVGTQLTTNNLTFTVVLDSFSLNCEFIDIGMSALKLVDETLLNGVSYSHGTTYRTSTTALPSGTSGAVSLLSGIRGSSIKTLITRFQESSLANNISGKYNSKNPNVNSIAFNIGGIKFPQTVTNPLALPANAFEQLQKAMGSFNSTQYNSAISPAIYMRLSAGGNAQAFTNSGQDYNYTNGASTVTCQDMFLWGQNLEICAKRGVLSGLNCSSAPIFVDLNIASANTNAHNMIVIAMQDSILIHNVITGDLQVRL
jgi:hypothetical protein